MKPSISVPGQEDPEQRQLPPRRISHPSNKGKMARLFYMSLFMLFLSLVIGLIFWGVHLKENTL